MPPIQTEPVFRFADCRMPCRSARNPSGTYEYWSYIPETVIENNDFTSFIETNDEWITTRTGIKTRRYAMNMPTWKIGSLAAEKAIERSGIPGNEIDLIICTTVTPDTLIPSTACLIQKELELNGCMAFDINCACSGFVYAVDMAQKYIAAGSARNVLD